MKRSWIFNTLAVVVLLSTLLAFTKGGNNQYAGEEPVKEKITPSQDKMSDNNNDPAQDIKLTESQRKMSDNINDFACNLFRTISKQKHGSIIVSPISVGYLLGMLNEGADGETRQQITNVLRLGGSAEEINEYFKKMMDEASKVDPKVTVKTANCIFFKSSEKIIPQYKADIQNYYDAQIEAINFSPSNIVNTINNWCNKHTDGMIPELVKKEELDPLAVMYLLNAVYFKASWTTEFDPQETRDKAFTKQDGTTVKHKMMHLKTKAACGENDLCKILRLPYGNGGYSMYVLLPNKGKTIDDIIQSHSGQKMKEWQSQMRTHDVDILLPRFTTESENGLIDVLSSMGMPRAFSMSADFPNMLQGHKDDLYVSKMKQKAKIEVNEKGTKAAAVTIAEMSEKGISSRPRIVEFHATRPFVYYIVENKTGTIYFMGTYCGEEGGEKVNCSEDAEMEDSDEEQDFYFGSFIEKPVEKPKESKEEIFRSVEQMPRFPGGEAALMKYIESHLNYPPTAANISIQGKVILQFVVKKDGSIGEVKVVRSVDKDLDREAVRIIKSLPKFTPGRQNGQVVSVWYTLPVTFKLPPENNTGLNNN